MYKVVKFRLNVMPKVFSRLYAILVAKTGLHRYVHVKREESGACIDDPVEVDINIVTGYDDLTKDYNSKRVTVTREMLDPLWDVLGIFPRTTFVPELNDEWTVLRTKAEQLFKSFSDSHHWPLSESGQAERVAQEIISKLKLLEQVLERGFELFQEYTANRNFTI